MTTFAQRVLRNPANAGILAWLGESAAGPLQLRPWVDLGYDEGGSELFEDAGAALPSAAKYSLGVNNICVHPDSARIYAAHWGRYTFLLRYPPDFRRPGDRAETLDGTVDLAGLEPSWSVHWFAEDEDTQALIDAHERAGAGGRE